jgi:dolichol-phosphate mannosyltransferase
VQWLGFAVAEIPYQPASRRAGVSKITFRRMFGFAMDGMLSFSQVPLRIAFVLGVIAICLSFLFLGAAAVRLWLSPDGLAIGLVGVLTAMHFLGGCILLCLGIVGEYVGRIYQQVKGRPLYLLKEKGPGLSGAESRTPYPKALADSTPWARGREQDAA